MPTHNELPPRKPPPKPANDVPLPRPVSAQRAMWVVVAAILLLVVAVFVFL